MSPIVGWDALIKICIPCTAGVLCVSINVSQPTKLEMRRIRRLPIDSEKKIVNAQVSILPPSAVNLSNAAACYLTEGHGGITNHTSCSVACQDLSSKLCERYF